MAYKKLKLWFDEALAQMLAEKIKPLYPSFNSNAFIQSVKEGIGTLELKDRVELMADELKDNLPENYEEALSILVNILGPENEKETGMFTEGYWVMPIAKFVEKYGLTHFDASLKAIKEITKRNTGEYSIRPYIEQYPEKTMALMLDWASDANTHVRRLACEGCRPRLPWAPKLQGFIDDPKPILPILNVLKDDPSKYVQKSVANTINDILKDNYEIGMELLNTWVEGAGKPRKWIIKHALRNQLKAKNPAAIAIIEKNKA